MATKAELLEQAKAKGLEVDENSSKADLQAALDGNSSPSSSDAVQVQSNDEGEATNGTSQEGDTSPVKNTDSIPQNDVKEVETTPLDAVNEADRPIAEKADADRTDEELAFSDESNPNQKARNASAPDEFDQDGNPRTGGYSYGVAPDDTDGTVPEEENKGNAPDSEATDLYGRVSNEPGVTLDALNQNQNAEEWDIEKQQKLEDQLSDPKAGIMARVTTSTGNYVRVKFFRNNKPLATYRSRAFNLGNIKKFLSRVRKEENV